MTAPENVYADLDAALITLIRGFGRLPAVKARWSKLLGAQVEPGTIKLLALLRSGPLRMSELAKRCSLDQSTVSRHVAHLERDDLACRSADPKDGRAFSVQLTAKGSKLLAKFDQVRRALLAEVLGDWTEKDIKTLASLLSRLVRDLETYGSEANE